MWMSRCRRVTWALYLMLAALAVAVTWASIAHVDQVSRSEGRIVPDGREQVIAKCRSGDLARAACQGKANVS